MTQQTEFKKDTFFTLVVGGEEILAYHMQVLVLGSSNENVLGAIPESLPEPRPLPKKPTAANEEPSNIVSLFTPR